jgi:myo-inositol 2-dehydrogenase / D-chiro-inositol 1-dehydrogenase
MKDISNCSRREFIGNTVGALASAAMLVGQVGRAAGADAAPAIDYKRKIKIGVVGNGERGSWIAALLKAHGGYDLHAVADYFPDVVARCGDALGVDKGRRFSGLSGYKRVIESGVEAVVLEAIPYFFPEHASAAVEAGLHVYMAKPVAVDAPGAARIAAAGKLATRNQRCFMVDYQMSTDPANIEVAERVRAGMLGEIAQVRTLAIFPGHDDPPKTATLESRMQQLTWDNDLALSGGYINAFDIHTLDAAIWVLGQRPVAASGASRICRPHPHGDSPDVCSVVYEYADGLVHNHFGQALPNNSDSPGGGMQCHIFGQQANALLAYAGKVSVIGGPKHYVGTVENLYQSGVVRNIAQFYENITGGRFENATVQRAVDGVLTVVLGREAALRRTKLTMDDLLKENKRLEADLRGLTA